MTVEYKKPLPRPLHVELTREFWEGTKRRELRIPRCKRCGRLFWYPREECPNCLSRDWEWHKATGKGRLYAYTVVRQPQHEAFYKDIPYIYAIVQLAEGVRLISNVVGCPVDEVRVDMPLEVVFEDVTSDWTLFKFKPV